MKIVLDCFVEYITFWFLREYFGKKGELFMSVVVAGSGWAGCAAAYAAASAGAQVVLIEKTDMLLGTGLVGGIMNNNGRFTAAAELRVMGADGFFNLIERAARHRCLDFPGHRHVSLYDVTRIEPLVRNALREAGVQLHLPTRVTGVEKCGGIIGAVSTADGRNIRGDVFIDCTGTAGPVKNCARFGRGCVMCILRCPTFGPRVSLSTRAGIAELRAGEGFPHFEAMSGSCKLDKKSLDLGLVRDLERKGVLVIPLPAQLYKREMLAKKACQQYVCGEFAENLVLLDTGHAKLMTPYFPLEALRTLEGFKDARYADPYSGGIGNSIRFMAVAPCDDALKVSGMENLFCAGEKAGLLVGHTEAIVTGFLAGHNAVRYLAGKELLVLPDSLAAGDIISFMHREMKTSSGLKKKYTFSGAGYFQRMRERGLYTTDNAVIRARVEKTGLAGLFKQKLVQ
jgi:hypothetical protein